MKRDARMVFAWCPFFGMCDNFVQTVERMVLCLVSILWRVEQLCTNCLTSCRKCGHSVPLVSSGACCVISAIVHPPSVHGGMYGNLVLRFVVPRCTVVRGRD